MKKIKYGVIGLIMVMCLSGLYLFDAYAENEDQVSYVIINQKFQETAEGYFELPQAGSVQFSGTGSFELYKVLDDGNEVEYASEASIYAMDNNSYDITDGKKNTYRLGKGKYRFTNARLTEIIFNPENPGEYEQEWNDTFDEANIINTNTWYTGNLNETSSIYPYIWSNDIDCYKFTISNPGSIYITYSMKNLGISNCNNNEITIYSEDSEGATKEIDKVKWASSTDKTGYSNKYRLPKGDYYIKIKANGCANSLDYRFIVNYQEESEESYEIEDNNTVDTANLIKVNSPYIGNLSNEEDCDVFKFNIDSISTVNMKMEVKRGSIDGLFTAVLIDGSKLDENEEEYIINSSKTTSNPISRSSKVTLSPGIYYILICYDTYNSDDKTDYKLTVEAKKEQLVESIKIKPVTKKLYIGDKIKLQAIITPSNAINKTCKWISSNTSIATVDKNGNVVCKKAGTVTITAYTSTYNKVSQSIKLKINNIKLSTPKLGKWKKVKLPKWADGDEYKITWSKVSNASGYQVVTYTSYSKKGKFYSYTQNTKNLYTTCGFSDYVYQIKCKVRAYKVVNGKKYYSKWSKTVSKVVG